MQKQTFFDRISFPTEYNTREELKASVILLFFTCLAFFLISSIAIIFNYFIFSKTLLLGTIAYELILIYLLNEETKKFIEKEVKGKAKRTLDLSSRLIFGSLILITFATLVYTMITPTPLTENKFISLSISLLIIVAPSFFWHELVMWFKKKSIKGLKIIGLIVLLIILFNPVMAQNETNTTTDIFSTISNTANTVQKGLDYFNQAAEFLGNIQNTIANTFHLTEQQTQVVILITVLISAFLILKFLSVIVKWVIVVLIAWIIIQMIFL